MNRDPIRHILQRRRGVLLLLILCLLLQACGGAASSQNQAGTQPDLTTQAAVPSSLPEKPAQTETANTEASPEQTTAGNTEGKTAGEPGPSNNAMLYMDDVSLDTVITARSYEYQQSKRNDNADRRLAQGPYVPEPVTVEQAAFEDLMAVLDGMEVSYTYAQAYRVEEARQAEARYEDARAHQAEHFDDPVCDIKEIPSAAQIRQAIEENNRRVLAENPGLFALDPAEIALIADIIHEMAAKNADIFTEADRLRIYSLLNDISAVGIDSYDFTVNDLRKPYNARVLEDGTIIIDLKTIETYLTGENAKEKTYEHEIYHLFQRMCPDAQIKDYTQIGPSQYFEDLAVNSLHWNWLYEAAAEKLTMNRWETMTALVYQNMVGYLKSLDLIAMLRPEYENAAVEELTLSVDPERLYAMSYAETEAERTEIVNLLYSIDYLQNNRDDLEPQIIDKDAVLADARTAAKIEMKNSIFLTFSKLFYRALAEQVMRGGVSLQDVFYLINAFEEDINYHSDMDEKPEKYTRFLETYVPLQDAFFVMLADGDETEARRLTDAFGSYAMVTKDGSTYARNCGLDWLTEAERGFLFEEIVTFDMSYLTVNIRELAR